MALGSDGQQLTVGAPVGVKRRQAVNLGIEDFGGRAGASHARTNCMWWQPFSCTC